MTLPQFFSIFLNFPHHVPSSPIHAIPDHSLKAFQLHADLTQAEISLNQSQLTSYDQTIMMEGTSRRTWKSIFLSADISKFFISKFIYQAFEEEFSL